jgi:N-acetylglucosamine-6-phosphate deacetylase
MDRKFALEAEAIRREAALDVREGTTSRLKTTVRETDAKIANMEKMADAKAKQKKKVKMKRTSDGYEVEEG